jgi:hypothetical protein
LDVALEKQKRREQVRMSVEQFPSRQILSYSRATKIARGAPKPVAARQFWISRKQFFSPEIQAA